MKFFSWTLQESFWYIRVFEILDHINNDEKYLIISVISVYITNDISLILLVLIFINDEILKLINIIVY